MAGKFDPRVDDLVMETRTLWDDSVGEELSNEDRRWVAQTIHQHQSGRESFPMRLASNRKLAEYQKLAARRKCQIDQIHQHIPPTPIL